MLSLIAAVLLAAAPAKPLAVLEDGTCIAGNAKASGRVVVLDPTHALIKDEEGNVIELFGSFVCFHVDEAKPAQPKQEL